MFVPLIFHYFKGHFSFRKSSAKTIDDEHASVRTPYFSPSKLSLLRLVILCHTFVLLLGWVVVFLRFMLRTKRLDSALPHLVQSFYNSFRIDAVNEAIFGPEKVVFVNKSGIILSVGQNFISM